ncbi:MAG: hypothetical protein ACRD3E_20325 [Terriglobales bacterium]
MKRTVCLSALALMIFACGTVVAQSSDQDLVAAARKARTQQKNAPATKVWTNEDIGSAPAPAAAAADAKTDMAKDAGKPADAAKGPSAEDKANAAAAMQKKIDAQKAEIATLSRELDLADREFKLQVANYYADAGNSLRDPKKWADERDAKQKEINDKKAAIDTAKAKLQDLLEQARKAGLKVNE